MRRPIILLASVASALLLGGGVAFAATLVGDYLPNTIDGTTDSDDIWGCGGNDQIQGLEGNDSLRPGGDSDVVRGGPGNDQIRGDAGAAPQPPFPHGCDTPVPGNDTIYGDADNDTIFSDAGNDKVYGGDGDDALRVGGYDPSTGHTLPANIWGGAGNDSIYGGDGTGALYGQGGADYIQGRGASYYGGRGRDRIAALNGIPETVKCGKGFDSASVDEDVPEAYPGVSDTVLGCEVAGWWVNVGEETPPSPT